MQKYRNTSQRKLVLDTVMELKGKHPTADEVFSNLHKSSPAVSKSTVYRNLNILCEQGEVLRVKIPNSADRMDANNVMHYHIYCEKCGRVDDVDAQHIENLEKCVKNSFGYKITGYDIVFIGLCPLCK